jgi:hypothetical protein
MSFDRRTERTATAAHWSVVHRNDATMYVTVDDYYVGDHPDFITTRLVLSVNTENGDPIEAEVTRADLLRLATQILSVVDG